MQLEMRTFDQVELQCPLKSPLSTQDSPFRTRFIWNSPIKKPVAKLIYSDADQTGPSRIIYLSGTGCKSVYENRENQPHI